ncbi:MAG: sugar transferase, partial [Syntrophales bacterium]|nr:sugar transferase [Syntrophales bacterium]
MLTRFLDILFSVIGCLMLLLMLPFIALLIKLDSRGPVFFRCNRVGKGGKIFKMYKFRTMFETSVPVGASVSPLGDPRVTAVGRILRRLKINEFPQLFNVLRGDMTLVGPRPEAPDLAAAYPPEAHRIFSVRPGLAGPNQILGRNEEEVYPQGVDLKKYYIEQILPWKLPVDLQYIDDQSLFKDLKYMFLAVKVTLTGAVARRHLTDNLSQ